MNCKTVQFIIERTSCKSKFHIFIFFLETLLKLTKQLDSESTKSLEEKREESVSPISTSRRSSRIRLLSPPLEEVLDETDKGLLMFLTRKYMEAKVGLSSDQIVKIKICLTHQCITIGLKFHV